MLARFSDLTMLARIAVVIPHIVISVWFIMLEGFRREITGRSVPLCIYCPSVSQIFYNDTRIQLLDLPGIIEGAAYGRGRGREASFTSHVS